MKFLNMRRPSDPNSSPPPLPSHPPHGVSMPTSPVVILNALGYIGFKVVSTCGNCEVSKFSLEGYSKQNWMIIFRFNKNVHLAQVAQYRNMPVCRSDSKMVCQPIVLSSQWFHGSVHQLLH